MPDEIYDIAILGAGPIGLEAALRAADEGYKTIVIERGEIGQNVRDWGHVKMFSPFGMNSSERGREVVGDIPDVADLLTGTQYQERYLRPLAASLESRASFFRDLDCVDIQRVGWPKSAGVGNPERGRALFKVRTQLPPSPDVHLPFDYQDTPTIYAKSVFDCTGSYGTSWKSSPINFRVRYLPCIGPLSPASHRGGRWLVIGSGLSAATDVCNLVDSGADVTWLTRGSGPMPLKRIANDPLDARRELVERGNQLATDGRVQWLGSYTVHEVQSAHPQEDPGFGKLAVAADHLDGSRRYWSSKEERFGNIVADIGFAPDISLFRELHVHLCYATEGPIKLAAKLLGEANSGAAGDCLAQTCDDASLLVNPEPNFFILGAKSYGRNSNFLIRVGIEQVDAVFDELLPKTLWPLIGRT